MSPRYKVLSIAQNEFQGQRLFSTRNSPEIDWHSINPFHFSSDFVGYAISSARGVCSGSDPFVLLGLWQIHRSTNFQRPIVGLIGFSFSACNGETPFRLLDLEITAQLLAVEGCATEKIPLFDVYNDEAFMFE